MSTGRLFTETLLLLGGNQGDVRSNGNEVVAYLSKFYQVESVTQWYKSPAWGFEGPDFLNCVVALRDVEDVHELLAHCLEVERHLGRIRKGKGYSDRPMDVDILYHRNEVVETEELSVPHPRIEDRRFTLVPLNEKWADFLHPILNKTQRELLEECSDPSEVTICIDEE